MFRLGSIHCAGIAARLVPIMLALIGVACGSTTPPQVRSSIAVRSVCPPAHSTDYFFPEGALIPQRADSDREQRSSISQYLEATGASPLSCGAEPMEAFRLLRVGEAIPEFEIAVRRRREGWTLELAEINRSATAPTPANRSTQTIHADQVAILKDAISKAEFWNLPAFLDVEGEGQVWVVEGRMDSSYKVVTRPSYRSSEPFEQLVRAFHRLSGRPLP